MVDLFGTLDDAAEEAGAVLDPTRAASDETEQTIDDVFGTFGAITGSPVGALGDQEARNIAGDVASGENVDGADVAGALGLFESSPLKIAAVVGVSYIVARELELGKVLGVV